MKGEKYIRGVVILWSLILSFSFPQEIGKLLKEYEEASELYRKTRKESLGHVIILYREDLEIMQAYTLGDVLKSLRLFTLSNNRFGVLNMWEFGSYSLIPRHYRLYINDHEVSSLHTGSPFLVWENFPLDLIEHIEIYQAPGAIELGNEPAVIIIKIYTKEPAKENVNRLRTTATSRRGYTSVFYRAKEVNSSFSYIFFVSAGSDNRKEYGTPNNTLSRDAFYRYAFTGLYFENMNFEIGYGFIKRLPFAGFALDNTVEYGFTRAEDTYFVFTAYPFKDKTLKFVFSLDNHRRKHHEKSSSGLYIPIFTDSIKEFHEDAFFSKVDLYISKTFISEKNKLLTAASYKLYNSDVDTRYYITLDGNRVDVGSTIPFDRQEIYSFIIEDQFSLNPRNLLISGLKLDKYYRNGGFKDFREYIIRVGYITTPYQGVYIKSFISRSYIPPYFYDLESAGRDLSPIKIPLSATGEVVFHSDMAKLNMGLGYVKVKDNIVPDSRGLPTNDSRTLEYKPLFLDIEYKIAEDHKLQTGYSAFLDPEIEMSPLEGAYIRILSSFHRLSAFGELIYRKGFSYRGKEIKAGYDLSAGISYNLTEDFSVKLKGENLLNKALEIPYFALQGSNVVSYPVKRRTFYLSVDWVF